jgi:hypothetical protein
MVGTAIVLYCYGSHTLSPYHREETFCVSARCDARHSVRHCALPGDTTAYAPPVSFILYSEASPLYKPSVYR